MCHISMNILAKMLNLVKLHQKDIFMGFCIVLISIISFNIGRINALHKTPIKITGEANVYQATTGTSVLNSKKTIPAQPKDPRVVASKASTTKNYDYITLHQTIDYIFTINYGNIG